MAFGSGAMTNSIAEIADTACILAVGTNTTEAHPIIGLKVKKAVRNGAKLIVINPREIDLCRSASIWLRPRLGTDVALLMGMARLIIDESLADEAFIKERCEDYEVFKESLKTFDLATVSQITGVPAEDISRAARMYATTKPASILYGMGVAHYSHGTNNVLAVANLAMLTGNIGKPSTGVNPLRGQNNVQGACDMGGLPNVYPGYQAVSDPLVRKKFEDAWGRPLSGAAGLMLPDLFDAIHQGKIKAVYCIGENPAVTEADISHVRAALDKLEFFVCEDIFLNETGEMADIVLPAASFAEEDGTFTNTERRVQRVRKAIDPPGAARPNWRIIAQLARKMGGKGFDWASPAEIMDEVARLTPSYGGISLERLEKGGLQWPCPTKEHPGTPILHKAVFTRGKGRFMPLEYKPLAEPPDDEYPLLLMTLRHLYQYDAGTMTRKTEGLNKLLGEEFADINPADAAKLGIANGDRVKVISRRGEVTAKAKLDEVTPPGVVSMDFHFVESPVNRLTNRAIDPVAKVPEFKSCAVKVVKAG